MRRNDDTPMTYDKHLIVVEKGKGEGTGGDIAIINEHIRFRPEVLDSFNVKGFSPKHYDLMVLCAAIELADRRWKRPAGWHRDLHVTIPATDVDTWLRPAVSQSLRSVMNHLTGDSWHFSFVGASNVTPIGSRQLPLIFDQNKTFAIAYSEGLDSRAVSALSGTKDEALCIRVAGKRQRRREGDSFFTQIPFKVRGFKAKESSFRSRGFQFAAMTAIAAHLSRITRIVVPESGQGALGPALAPLHNIYVDYRNFPTFFRKMEKFIRAIFDVSLRYEQPRLWSTKGQTLSAYLALPGKEQKHLANTKSCWQSRRVVNDGKRRQCGLCAACLLRRQSMFAAGVVEPPETYVVSDLSTGNLDVALSRIRGKADRDIMIEYGSVGARHLQHLADLAALPDTALRIHASQIGAATAQSYHDTLQKLKMMLMTHAQEWRTFLSAQGEQSFLRGWMDGGRYGRFE